MITLKKIALIVLFSLFVWAMLYHFYRQFTDWVNQPSQTEIKEQYRKVGY